MRDFIYVEDVASVNLWFFMNPDKFGIFNLGTGQARTFNDVAYTVLKWHKEYRDIDANIEYTEFPEKLLEAYQSYTRADISLLRDIGYHQEFQSIEEGIEKYLNILNHNLVL
jgi:ADP-L-glycero-D-manno-heptose 6-epimerase